MAAAVAALLAVVEAAAVEVAVFAAVVAEFAAVVAEFAAVVAAVAAVSAAIAFVAPTELLSVCSWTTYKFCKSALFNASAVRFDPSDQATNWLSPGVCLSIVRVTPLAGAVVICTCVPLVQLKSVPSTNVDV